MGNNICSCVCMDKRKQRHATPYQTHHLNNVQPSNNIIFNIVQPVLDINSNILAILEAIRQLVDIGQNSLPSMFLLPRHADKDEGWIEVMCGLINFLPENDPLSPAVINQLVEECPIPSKNVIENIITTLEIDKLLCNSYQLHNACILISCLAEKMAGPTSISLMTEDVLNFLFKNLNNLEDQRTILYSIIALEKFALTAENKLIILKRLEVSNPLSSYEIYYDDQSNFILRQVGFCCQWTLDNIFNLKDRNYSYLKRDMSNINALLNSHDVSEYLKLSSSGLEARCDSNSFESVRSTFQVCEGVWYYEVTLITNGIMQIGWATKQSKFLTQEGYGIGDDTFSIAYDGCRQLVWFGAKSTKHDHSIWKSGDIIGLLLDIDNKQVIFSLNGDPLPPNSALFTSSQSGYFAAASFMSFQQCHFNFGLEKFKYPPKRIKFKSFNDNCIISNDHKIVLPRPLKLLEYCDMKYEESSCILCADRPASIQLKPCLHRGFCEDCSNMLENCPMCRMTIEERITNI